MFFEDSVCYRQINQPYKNDYEHLMNGGLYDMLTKDRLLIPHGEAGINLAKTTEAFKVVSPEHIPFISYPYETSNYSAAGMGSKSTIIEDFLDRIEPKNVWESAIQTAPYGKKKPACERGVRKRALQIDFPAASYSPTQPPVQYHRR